VALIAVGAISGENMAGSVWNQAGSSLWELSIKNTNYVMQPLKAAMSLVSEDL
jgi:hypothetical protein